MAGTMSGGAKLLPPERKSVLRGGLKSQVRDRLRHLPVETAEDMLAALREGCQPVSNAARINLALAKRVLLTNDEVDKILASPRLKAHRPRLAVPLEPLRDPFGAVPVTRRLRLHSDAAEPEAKTHRLLTWPSILGRGKHVRQ